MKTTTTHYEVYKFPSVYGTPWSFRWLIAAKLAAIVRSGFGMRLCDIQILSRTKKP